jgi:hypothetical protein
MAYGVFLSPAFINRKGGRGRGEGERGEGE